MDPTSSAARLLIGAILAAGLLLWLGRLDSVRAALRLVLSRPAFLVPTAMTLVATAAIAYFTDESGYLHENPLAPAFGAPETFGLWPAWLVLAIAGLSIAGHIGLLEAHARGARTDGDAFRAGVRRHGATVLLGKLALCVAVAVIREGLGPRAWLIIVFALPSLLVAPLVGIASTLPNHPLRALLRSIEYAYANLSRVGRVVTAQIVVLITLVFCHDRIGGYWLPPESLATSSSTLNVGQFPLTSGVTTDWAFALLAITGAFSSAVFLTAHWLGVTQGYALRDSSRGGGETRTSDAHGTRAR